jgi:hypothetical protein
MVREMARCRNDRISYIMGALRVPQFRAWTAEACDGRSDHLRTMRQTPAEALLSGRRSRLPAGAVLCVNCGYHLGLGRRIKTRHERLRRVWEPSRSLPKRVVMFAALLIFGGFFAIALWNSESWWLAWAPLAAICVTGVLLLTPLRFHRRIVLQRDSHGHFRLSKREWICLIPIVRWSIRLDGQDKAYIDFVPGRDRWGRETGYFTLSVARDRHDAPYMVYQGGDERDARHRRRPERPRRGPPGAPVTVGGAAGQGGLPCVAVICFDVRRLFRKSPRRIGM